ncbi:MAG: hypothetical protein LC797_16870 [Chloroflexi bacterium]|nr:hypothetical protein [Chloroflexota bacterium]
MSNFTRDMQRWRRETDSGWVLNCPRIGDNIISPPGQRRRRIHAAQRAKALAEIATQESYTDALSMHLQKAPSVQDATPTPTPVPPTATQSFMASLKRAAEGRDALRCG